VPFFFFLFLYSVTNITIIVHGKHGPNSLIHRFCELTKNQPAFKTELYLTQHQGHAKQLTLSAIQNGTHIIIASGGDGTINEVVNGIIDSGNNQIRMTIVPAGTGNDFMRPRTHFTSASHILDSIISEKFQPIDLGMITSHNNHHYFLNIADAGFGGSTVHTLNQVRGLISGKIAYPLAILITFLKYRKPKIALRVGEHYYSGPALMVAVCNGSCFGNGIYIHPGADPTDGKLNITLLGKVSLFDYIRYLPKLKKGMKIKHPELHYVEGTDCTIQLISGKMDIEADGEIVTLQNPEIKILPGVLRYIGPDY
jgi:YegS/Rv2252/BmrU family lipid kinase